MVSGSSSSVPSPTSHHSSVDAISFGKYDVAFALLEDPHIKNVELYSALKQAISKGQLKFVLILLEDPRIKADDIQRALLKAIGYGRSLDIIHALLNHRKSEADNVNKALIYASKKGEFSIVQVLLEDERVDDEAVNEAFSMACKKNHEKIISHLFKDTRLNLNGALVAVSRNGQQDIVYQLLENDTIKVRFVMKAFESAFKNNHRDLAYHILKDRRVSPADLKAVFDRACKEGNKDLIGHLLKDERIESSDVNKGFGKLPSMDLETIIKFLDYENLEPKFARKILELAFAKNAISKVLKLKSVDHIKREIAIVLSYYPVAPSEVSYCVLGKMVDIFDLNFMNICKALEHSKVLHNYIDHLSGKLANIIDNLGNNTDLDAEEISQIPELSLHVFNALLTLSADKKLFLGHSSLFVSLTDKLLHLFHLLETLKNIPYIELAQASLLFAPQRFVSSLKQVLETPMPSTDKAFLNNFLEEIEKANIDRETYFMDFEKYLNDGYEGKNADLLPMFLKLHLGTEMCSRELDLARLLIVMELGNSSVPKNMADIGNPSDYVLIDWILISWKSGNRELIDLVLKTWMDHWEDKRLIDGLFIELVRRYAEMGNLKFYAAKNKVEAVQTLLRFIPRYYDHFNLQIYLILNQIHKIPLDDDQFFGPSFALISNPKDYRLEYRALEINGRASLVDVWIEVILYAMVDPRRHFLKTHGVENQFFPDFDVDPTVFFALGRLIGKALSNNVEIPFSLHPKWLQSMANPGNTAFFEECFKEFYEEELKLIKNELDYNKAKKRAFSVIESFRKGLDIYIKTESLCWIRTPLLLDIFSPSSEHPIEGSAPSQGNF